MATAIQQIETLSQVGKVRDHNEDTLLADRDLGLYLVADGMGGHAAGEVASALAVKVTQQQIAAGKKLKGAIQFAHHAILQQSQEQPQQQGMGTTIVAVQEHKLYLELAWVGDSRIYRFADDKLEQLSIDHSFVQDMVLREVLTEEQARNHPDSSLLRQALGKQDLPDVKVDVLKLALDHSGLLLLCSDGVSDMLSFEQLSELFSNNASVSVENLAALIEQAVMETPASDNFTFILIDYQPGVIRRAIAKIK